jgi:iron(II)-dependent oxidoreductase
MLTVMLPRRLSLMPPDYRVSSPLRPRQPDTDCAAIAQGHYRVGSRHEPFAYDNELPPQAVELSSFRIARHPVANAEFLGFIEAGGYQDRTFWSGNGWGWRTRSGNDHPLPWRRDARGGWYGVGLNGASDLESTEPVMGISQHEARAFAAWASASSSALAGAVLQHEYQWEVAARSGALAGTGRLWEWCANPFHPYPEFTPFPAEALSQAYFDGAHFSLRGASLHTQPALRRASFRQWARPEEKFRFAGLRLVLPPQD